MNVFDRTTASADAAPWLVTWRDPRGRLVLELPLRVIREIDDACNGTAACRAGVLVGAVQSRVRIHYAFALELDDKGDLSLSAREKLLTCSPDEHKTTSTVGLFASNAEDQPITIHRIAFLGKRLFPEVMPVLLVGKESASVFLWEGATAHLTPLSPELSLRQLELPGEPQPFPDDAPEFAGIPDAMAGAWPQAAVNRVPETPKGYAAAAPFDASKVTVRLHFPLWMWIVPVLIAVLAFYAGRFGFPPLTPANPAASPVPQISSDRNQLGFQALHRGTDVLLSWDRNAATMLRARNALVEIRDGGAPRTVPITDTDLTSGRMLYVPGSQDAEITFFAFAESGVIRESVKVLHRGPPRDNIPGTGKAR